MSEASKKNEPAQPSLRRSLGLTALVGVALLYAIPYAPRNGVTDEEVRIHTTASLAESGSYSLGDIRRRWGQASDTACVERSRRGRVYRCSSTGVRPRLSRAYFSAKAPFASWLALPGYQLHRVFAAPPGNLALATWLSRWTGSFLPFLFFLFFAHRWFGRRMRSALLRDLSWFALAFGPALFGRALVLGGHVPAACSAFASFMLLSDIDRSELGAGTRPRLWWSGLFAAAAAGFDYPAAFVSIGLFTYMLGLTRAKRSSVFLFLFGALFPLTLLLHFHWSAFGTPLTLPHYFREDVARRAYRGSFFALLHLPMEAIRDQLVHPRLGLLVTTPMLVLSPLALRMVRGWRAIIALVTALVLLWFSASIQNWEGDGGYGPRHLIVLVPFLLAGVGLSLDRLRLKWLAESAALGASLAGILLTLCVAAIPRMPELRVPVEELFHGMLAQGYGPRNLLSPWGVEGLFAYLPLALLMFGGLVWVLRGASTQLLRISVLGAAALLLFLVPSTFRRAGDEFSRARAAALYEEWGDSSGGTPERLERELAEAMQTGAAEPVLRELLEDLHERYRAQHRSEDVRRIRAIGSARDISLRVRGSNR